MTASEADRQKVKFDLRDESSISKTAPARVAPAIDARVERGGQVTAPLRQQIKQAIRRTELRQIVPLADTTIYEMEQRGEFPRRFYLTPRCVVWDLAEVEAWIEARQRVSDATAFKRASMPNVRQRKTRPVRR